MSRRKGDPEEQGGYRPSEMGPERRAVSNAAPGEDTPYVEALIEKVAKLRAEGALVQMPIRRLPPGFKRRSYKPKAPDGEAK